MLTNTYAGPACFTHVYGTAKPPLNVSLKRLVFGETLRTLRVPSSTNQQRRASTAWNGIASCAAACHHCSGQRRSMLCTMHSYMLDADVCEAPFMRTYRRHHSPLARRSLVLHAFCCVLCSRVCVFFTTIVCRSVFGMLLIPPSLVWLEGVRYLLNARELRVRGEFC